MTSITNSDDLRVKIHEIHNYMRNNGIGYGLSSLKVFNFLYGLMKIEEFNNDFSQGALQALIKKEKQADR